MSKSNNNPKIANFCLNIVQEFAMSPIEWDEFQLHRGFWSSMLKSQTIPQTRLNENGNVVSVIAMQNGFFLYMDMAFEYAQKKNLQAISIHFYDESELLLRTDWSYQEFSKTRHAQPHWHMGARLQKNVSQPQYAQTFAEFGNFKNFQLETVDATMGLDISRMHLFMAYDENKNDSLDFRDERILKNWLKHTLCYIDGQLRALKKHTVE